MTRKYRPALLAGLLFICLMAPGAPARAADETEPVGETGAEAVEAVPEKSEYQQGLEATWAGDYESARAHLETHLARSPDDAQAMLSLARVEFWTNRYDESIALYDQYLGLRPHDIDGKVELAHSLFWAGDLVRTEAVARNAVTIEPENIKANLILAAVLQSTDRKDEADGVYDWILTLDPSNTNAKNRQALARPPAERAGGAFVLTSRNLLNGDNFDFIGFKSVTGLGMGFFGFLTVQPQLRIRILDDPRVPSPLTGIGPGLRLGFSTGTPVSLWARGAYVPMVGEGRTVHGWSAGAGIDVRFTDEFTLWGAYNTELHGLERQSALAIHEGLRRHEGLLGAYWSPGWFRLVASGALGGVYDGDATLGLNMSWWLSPAVRVHDGDWKIYMGYGFWGMLYEDPAPMYAAPTGGTFGAYWDPAAALSHTLYVDIEARLHAHWKLFANLGGGLAQEREWATSTTDSTWAIAGLVNGRLAFGWTPSSAFEARLGGGFGLSSRGGDPYTSWNVLLDLIGRW